MAEQPAADRRIEPVVAVKRRNVHHAESKPQAMEQPAVSKVKAVTAAQWPVPRPAHEAGTEVVPLAKVERSGDTKPHRAASAKLVFEAAAKSKPQKKLETTRKVAESPPISTRRQQAPIVMTHPVVRPESRPLHPEITTMETPAIESAAVIMEPEEMSMLPKVEQPLLAERLQQELPVLTERQAEQTAVLLEVVPDDVEERLTEYLEMTDGAATETVTGLLVTIAEAAERLQVLAASGELASEEAEQIEVLLLELYQELTALIGVDCDEADMRRFIAQMRSEAYTPEVVLVQHDGLTDAGTHEIKLGILSMPGKLSGAVRELGAQALGQLALRAA